MANFERLKEGRSQSALVNLSAKRDSIKSRGFRNNRIYYPAPEVALKSCIYHELYNCQFISHWKSLYELN